MSDKRILALDYGKKRIGVALSAPLNLFATPWGTLENTGTKALIETLQTIIADNDVGTIVLGLPLQLDGTARPLSIKIEGLADTLRRATGLVVELVDERYSSSLATKTLQSQGLNPSRNRGLIDETAAVLILQTYLEQQRSG